MDCLKLFVFPNDLEHLNLAISDEREYIKIGQFLKELKFIKTFSFEFHFPLKNKMFMDFPNLQKISFKMGSHHDFEIYEIMKFFKNQNISFVFYWNHM